ncbi:hypothetical protein [Kitasatospora sp. NBC_00458]|uniref:hypothetical protein n=1 Tax=Kitasatospora sp. NBC_00458 TaxID=2903568 RepID=UPI002E17E36C
MGLWSKLTGTPPAEPPPGRTAAARRRREREIRRIDAGTAAWLRTGGVGHRRDR